MTQARERPARDVWRHLLVSAGAVALYRACEAVPDLSSSAAVCLLLLLLTLACALRREEDPEPRSAFDRVALLLHGILFLTLALSVLDPGLFVRLYAALLAVDALRLWMSLATESGDRVWTVWDPGQAPHRRRMLNRFWTAALLLSAELAWQLDWLGRDAWIGVSLLAGTAAGLLHLMAGAARTTEP